MCQPLKRQKAPVPCRTGATLLLADWADAQNLLSFRLRLRFRRRLDRDEGISIEVLDELVSVDKNFLANWRNNDLTVLGFLPYCVFGYAKSLGRVLNGKHLRYSIFIHIHMYEPPFY